MDQLLSQASGIVVLSMISCGIVLILQPRMTTVKAAIVLLVSSVILILLDLNTSVDIGMQSGFPYALLLLALPTILLFKDALPAKCFSFLFQLFSTCVTCGLSSLIANALYEKHTAAYQGLWLCCFVLLGGTFLCWLSRTGKRLLQDILFRNPDWSLVLYGFGPCLGSILIPTALDASPENPSMLAPLLLVFAAWSVSVLILAILSAFSKVQAEHDLVMTRSILDACTMQSADFEKMMEASRILRHDCKHHLHVAQILLETGQIEEARAYLLAFGIKCDECVVTRFCSSPAVNALLIGYQKKCQIKNIQFSAVLELPENPPMDSFELCTLLGNLLENALEACQSAPEGNRQMILRGAPQGGHLMITVKNTFDGTVLKEEGHIISKKGSAGGLGIKSIKAIASRHNGEYMPQWDDQSFTASVMLRL